MERVDRGLTLYTPVICLEGLGRSSRNLRMTGFRAEVLTKKFTNVMEEYYPLKSDVRAVFNFKIKTIFLDLTFHVFLKLNYILKTKRE